MLNIQYTGHNIELTQALKDFVKEKSEKLHRHCHGVTTLHVTLSVEREDHIAEGNISLNKFECHAISDSKDMYHSIDQMLDKLDKQLIKHKEKQQDQRD